MDLKIKDQIFIVCGATSGLGKGVAIALLNDGARLIAIARNENKLKELEASYPHQVEYLAMDVTLPGSIDRIMGMAGHRDISGVLINAGGPPAKSVLETNISDWDSGYESLLRWKITWTKRFAEKMINRGYGRILLIESSTVKQPLENLVLSNSFRLAVVGFAKTFSQEIAHHGVTINILAPGFHETPAVERLYKKKSSNENISLDEAKQSFISSIKVGKIGNPEEFGMLAAWLLSPHASYITGQTISVDGGFIAGVMG